MRLAHYSDILRGSASLAGLGAEDVGVAEFALYREGHDTWLQKCWEEYEWPDICRTEQRWFRPFWSDLESYAAGDEVFDPASQAYYQSLQGSNEANPPTVDGVVEASVWALCQLSYGAAAWAESTPYSIGDQVTYQAVAYQCIVGHTSSTTFVAGNWAVLTPFLRTIDAEQDGETAIGEVLKAWPKDPRLTTRQSPLTVEVLPDSFLIREGVVFAWVKYRLRRPELTGEAFDEGTVYTSGRQVYYVWRAGAALGQGDFYTANDTTAAGESPEANPTKWDRVELPYVFRKPLIEGGHARWLKGDGQSDKALVQAGEAQAALDDELDQLLRQQGQTGRLNFVPN